MSEDVSKIVVAEVDKIKAAALAVPQERRTWDAADEHGKWPSATPAWCVNELREGKWVGDVAYIPQHIADQEAIATFMGTVDPATVLALIKRIEFLDESRSRWRRSAHRLRETRDALETEVQSLSAKAERRIGADTADAWEEGFEAGHTYLSAYTHGNNGPSDPPVNPYEEA